MAIDLKSNWKKHAVCLASGMITSASISYTGSLASGILATIHRCIPGPYGQIGGLVIEITGNGLAIYTGITMGTKASNVIAELIDDEEWLYFIKS